MPKQQRHFLQSAEWATFLKAYGHRIIEQKNKGWSYAAIIESSDGPVGTFFKRAYCPYGPHASTIASLPTALASLEKDARTHGADYVRIEPTLQDDTLESLLIKHRYHKHERPANPPLTNCIDLLQPEESILKNMSKTNSYLWRKAALNKLTFHTDFSQDASDLFLDMLHDTSERTGAIFHEDAYYVTLIKTLGPSKAIGIATVQHNGTPVASAMFADDKDGKTRIYLHAGAYEASRKISANNALLSYLIFDAKEQGLHTFDMFGVAPIHDKNHRWAGFSAFKRSFGGTDVAYAGTWEKPIRNVRYQALQTARSIVKFIK